MKTENTLTFMSWDNKESYRKGGVVRAIALCDTNGYFHAAINCMRDGDMGKKDENGVYDRVWWGDYIGNGDVHDLRPATYREVQLYLQYCPLKEQEMKEMYHRKFTKICYGYERTTVTERATFPWRKYFGWIPFLKKSDYDF